LSGQGKDKRELPLRLHWKTSQRAGSKEVRAEFGSVGFPRRGKRSLKREIRADTGGVEAKKKSLRASLCTNFRPRELIEENELHAKKRGLSTVKGRGRRTLMFKIFRPAIRKVSLRIADILQKVKSHRRRNKKQLGLDPLGKSAGLCPLYTRDKNLALQFSGGAGHHDLGEGCRKKNGVGGEKTKGIRPPYLVARRSKALSTGHYLRLRIGQS